MRAASGLFIATDGAADWLAALGIAPDVVLGDFDSVDEATRPRLAGAEWVHAPDQEASDLDKALAHALERGADTLDVAGAVGGRLDHTLTAVALAVKYHRLCRLRLVTDTQQLWAVSGSAEVRGVPGDTVSLVPFGDADGVSVEGVRWPLVDEPLPAGSRGVSNSLIGPAARVRVARGVVIVCLGRGPLAP